MVLSDEKKRGYVRRLLLSRMRLLIKNGFYGLRLMHISFALDDSCKTAGTDGKRIFFSPAFLDELSDSELDFVLMHEILHVVLQHCFRRGDREAERFNAACDIVVNSNILRSNDMDTNSITLKKYGESMHIAPDGKEGYEYTAEQVYDMLAASLKGNASGASKQKGASALGTSKQGDGNSKCGQGAFDDHSHWDNESDGNMLTEEQMYDMLAASLKGNASGASKQKGSSASETSKQGDGNSKCGQGAIDDHSHWENESDGDMLREEQVYDMLAASLKGNASGTSKQGGGNSKCGQGAFDDHSRWDNESDGDMLAALKDNASGASKQKGANAPGTSKQGDGNSKCGQGAFDDHSNWDNESDGDMLAASLKGNASGASKQKGASAPGTSKQGDGNSKCGQGAFDDHSQWDNESDGDMLTDAWTKHLMDACEAIEIHDPSNSRGLIPLFAERMLKELRRPQTDWRTILNDFVQEEINDYSFTPPDRRFDDSPFFLPDFNEKEDGVGDILFMIDTSGSMSDDMITAAYSEVKGAIDQFDGKLKGWLGFFDAEIIEPQPFETEDELRVIRPKGGGGTDFHIIFEYVRQNMQDRLPTSIIILTDGYAPFPDEAQAMGIPVLWLLNNDDAEPPWGKIARISVERYAQKAEHQL